MMRPMNGVGRIPSKHGTEFDQPPGNRDLELAQLAAQQHGVVALHQLRELGLSASAARSRVASGRLHRVHQGVYAVGHAVLAVEGRWIAAVLACGPGAALSHRSAASLWALRASTRPAIDVTVPRRTGLSRPGIDIHRTTSLERADTTRVRGVPCTTVARTLLDLAEVVGRRELERACEQAEMLRVLDTRAVEDLLGRAEGRRGAPVLRAILGEQTDDSLTRSELERRFLALCAAAGIPRPRVNAWIDLDGGGVEVDFLWEARRLIAETDGHRVHGTRRAFERDRRRDQRLALARWRVVRLTWRQITLDPDEVARTIAGMLG
jgi:predicted transcriptional regulator of viral defense system